MRKYPEIFFFNIIEILPKGLNEAVESYCREVLKMTFEQARRKLMNEWRIKLFQNAEEYQKTKQELEKTREAEND